MSFNSVSATNSFSNSEDSKSGTSIIIQTKDNSYSLDGLQLYHPVDSRTDLRIDGKLFKSADGSTARERVIRPGVPILEQWDEDGIRDYTRANHSKGTLHWTYRGSGVPDNDLDRFNIAVRDFASRYEASLEALSRQKNESWAVVLERSERRQEEGETDISELNSKIYADWTEYLKSIQENITVLEAMKPQLGPIIFQKFQTVFEAQQQRMLSEFKQGADMSAELSQNHAVTNDWLTGAVKDYHVRAHSAIEDLTSFVSECFKSNPKGNIFRRDTWSEDDRRDRDYEWMTLNKDIKTGWGSTTFVPRTLQEFRRLLQTPMIDQTASEEGSRG